MKKLISTILTLLIALGAASALAAGWHTERWVDENGVQRIRVVDDNSPDLTDEQVRRSNELKAQLNPFYNDYDVVYEGSTYTELRQRGTGKVIRINKPLQ